MAIKAYTGRLAGVLLRVAVQQLLSLPKLKNTVRYPADINLALYPEQYFDIPRLYLYARLPLQFLLAWFV
ncbi:hypothetical protein FQP89_13570 [Vreelandella titanicae]|uniref:Uncharacterized protein n=1 Tax=Vreelandella titanicae TaxID=664683 RepID=A0A558J5Y9_9GAMM|nr:hypothetical protein FQP89_13570 [Halomonas titanicae]